MQNQYTKATIPCIKMPDIMSGKEHFQFRVEKGYFTTILAERTAPLLAMRTR